MKRFLIIAFTSAILGVFLFGCIGAKSPSDPKPVIKQTSVPTIAPTSSPKPTAKPTVTPATTFRITSNKPAAEDWLNPNLDFPKELYEVDYFIDAQHSFNSLTANVCAPNRQVQQDWSSLYTKTKDERYNLDTLIETAKRCFADYYTVDYRNINTTYNRLIYDYGDISGNRKMLSKYMYDIKNNKVSMVGRMITDRSLVYRDTDGWTRIRGYGCVKVLQASDSFLKDADFTIGWNFYVIEYVFNYKYKKGWKYSPYVVWYAHEIDACTEVTPEKLALIKKYGGIEP